MKSESMPLTVTILNAIQIISFFEEMYHKFQIRAKYIFTIKKKTIKQTNDLAERKDISHCKKYPL